MSFENAQTINVATPAALSALPTLGAGPGGLKTGYSDGTTAFVASVALTYVLQTSSAVIDGTIVLKTRDDSTRRWVIEDSSITGIASVASAGGTIAVTNPLGPAVNLEVVQANAAPAAIAAAGAVGASARSARQDHTHAGVTSFNGAGGVVNYAPVLTVPNAATLAGTVVAAYTTGQQAFVSGTGLVYVLQDTSGLAPDNRYVIATSDDVTRQWLLLTAANIETFFTAALDWTVVQSVELIPARTGYCPILVSRQTLVVSRAGILTTGATFQLGNNAGHNNIMAATANAPTAANTNTLTPPIQSTPGNFAASSTAPLLAGTAAFFDITLGATGTGGFALSAREVVIVTWVRGT